MLRRLGEARRKRYGRLRNVLDVGVGLKFVAGAPVGDALCIQFCVSRKTRPRGRDRLPRFVYARRRDGSPDRSRRVATDVVVVKGARFACAAGTRLDAPGEFGTQTLLFQNGGDGLYYLLTCAHVAGDLQRSPPADPRLDSDCCPGRQFATTLLNSTHTQAPWSPRDRFIAADLLAAGRASVVPLATGTPVRQIHLHFHEAICGSRCGSGERLFHLDPEQRPFFQVTDWIS